MKRSYCCALVLFAFSIAASQQRGEVQSGDQNVTKATQPARVESGLRAELRGSGYGSVLLSPNSRAHLHFILFSNSDGLKVYQDWNSWGYHSRSFKAQDEKFKVYEITPQAGMHWTRNFPSTDTINKGDVLVTDVYLCSWRITPKLTSTAQGTALRLTGRFTIQDTPANRKVVWTGKVETPPLEVIVDEACVASLNAD